MTDFLIRETDLILRDASPMQQFLSNITQVVQAILTTVKYSLINTSVFHDPLVLLPIGFIALMGTIGIVKRLLSRD